MPTNKFFFIDEKKMNLFFSKLLKDYELIAPVKRDKIHVFDSIKNFSEADLNFINTTFPAKKYFIEHKEKIISYDDKTIIASHDDSKRIIFGIRQDKIFLGGNFKDPYYEKRRKNSLIFAMNCTEAGENCFCTSLGTDTLTEGFDLLFSKVPQGYVVEVGSTRGEEIINDNGDVFTYSDGREKDIKRVVCKKKISKEEIEKLETAFHSDIWEKYAKKCLSCCSCTITCPNCGCFGFRDVISIDLKSGKRIREWQSCQLKVFTKVAGEFVFRSEREQRLKHRIYHQLNYFKKQYNVEYCVGCGRCISNCPTGIDMIKIIKEI